MPTPNPSPFRDATAVSRGFISTSNQEFSGMKSFLSPLKMASYSEEDLPTGAEYPEGMVALKGTFLYNSTVNRMMVNTGAQWLQVVLAAGLDDPASLEEHLIDTTNAHMAGSIGCPPLIENTWANGDEFNFGVGTDVKSVFDQFIAELAENIGSKSGAQRIGALQAGTRVGLNVQTQLGELDTSKAALAGAAFTGDISAPAISTNVISASVGDFSNEILCGGPANIDSDVVAGVGGVGDLKWGTPKTFYHYIPADRFMVVAGSASLSGGVDGADWDAPSAGTNYTLMASTRLPPGALVTAVDVMVQSWYNPSAPTGTVTMTAGHMVKTASGVAQVGNDQVVINGSAAPLVDTLMTWYSMPVNGTRNPAPNDGYFRVSLVANNSDTGARLQIQDVRITYTMTTVGF